MNNLKTVIRVGIADLNFVQAPSIIRTSGLGSCVGVVIYDLFKKTAGLAHIMLPYSNPEKKDNQYKYADTSIKVLINQLLRENSSKYRLKAKIAGGAQMFQLTTGSDIMRIGPRNVDAVREQLQKHQIPIVSEDVGGNSGRTIEFDPETGDLNIRTVNKGEKVI